MLRYREAEIDYLLLRAYNYWDFPKGRVEAKEDPFECALREVREETSLRKLDFRWGKTFRETQPYGRAKVARYYVAESLGEEVCLGINPQLGRPEHHEFRWLCYQPARKLLIPRVQQILDWAQEVTHE